MESCLYGIDISPVAAHLTAASLSNIEPAVDYHHTNIGVAAVCGPKGRTGSLELLTQESIGDILGAAGATTITDSGAHSDISAPHKQFDVIVMNPPYSRTRGGQALFDVAGATDTQRRKAQRRASQLLKNTPANLKAGLGSAFCELARIKLKPGGRLALVLPMTAAASPAWADTRRSLETHFDDLMVVSLAAGSKGKEESLSEDTSMGEMLLFATRNNSDTANTNSEAMTAVVIDQQFESTFQAAETARAITQTTSNTRQDARTDGVIYLGQTQTGRWTRTPLRHGAPWPEVGAADFGVITLIEKLIATGDLTPIGAHKPVTSVPMTTIGDLFDVGPTHDRIGYPHEGDPRGAFEVHKITDTLIRSDELLWASNNTTQTSIQTQPTHYGTPSGKTNPAAIRATKSTLFYQRGIRWTSQKLLAAVTTRETLGGRAWASLTHDDPDVRFGFAIWANSSLGMALHWTRGQRQQQGRTQTQIGAIKTMPCPDFTNPTLKQHAHLLRTTNPELVTTTLDRACNAASDPGREQLDEATAWMLGLNDTTPLRNIANNWTREPSVLGNRTQTTPRPYVPRLQSRLPYITTPAR